MMQFGDSMLPTGAFAFSSALEAAVQKKVVHDAETLRQFVETAVEQAARGDAVGVAWASRAARGATADGDADGAAMALLRLVDEALFVRKLPDESRSMTVRTGKKLAEVGEAVTGSPLMSRWLEHIRSGNTPGTYPVTLAILFAAMETGQGGRTGGALPESPPESADALDASRAVPASLRALAPEDDALLQETLTVHLYGVAMGILNAALRLMRLTHIEAQSVLYGVAARFDELAREAADTPLEHMSNYAPMTDILGAVHGQAHVRLFMS